MKLVHLVRLARPQHWIKNVIVLFPVVFAQQVGKPAAWLGAVAAMLAFSLAASSVYAVNDIKDRHSDRLHPRKKDRPLASGAVSPAVAWVESLVLFLAASAIAVPLGAVTLAVIWSYVVLQLVYTFGLKERMIVDVMCIALGFVLRAVAGATAIRVELSPWLFTCTFTICLFMGFCKRRSEAGAIGDSETAAMHRRTLVGYTPQLLTHLTTLSAGIAIVSYLLYATSPRTVENFGTNYLLYTLPLVIYAVCRFEMLSAVGAYADPTDLILRDRPFQMTLALWCLAVAGILWQGPQLQTWLSRQ